MLRILILQILNAEQITVNRETIFYKITFPPTIIIANESAMADPSWTRTGTNFKGFSFSNSAFSGSH